MRRVSRPALALFALLVWAGQATPVFSSPAGGARDVTLLLAVVTALTAVLTSAVALAAAAAARYRRPVSVALWTVAYIAAGIFVCDALSYGWLALHLDESLVMLYLYAQADPIGIASKLIGLSAGAALILCVSGALAYWVATAGRAVSTSQARFRPLFGVVVCLVFWLGTETAAARLLSSAGLGVRRHAIWIPAAVPASARADAGSLFTIDRPRFVQLPGAAAGRAQLDRITPASVAAPLNVFFFVVESLRADTAASDVMPALAARRSEALTADLQVAGGNCTHVSWTSLLHGVNPLYWTVKLHQPESDGSVPLIALKRAGYRLHAYSSYELNYFGADRAAFGRDLTLIDEAMGQQALTSRYPGRDIAGLDEAVFDQLMAGAKRRPAGGRNLYFGFLGAMHHAYRWPETFVPPFQPFLPASDIVLRGMQPSSAELLRARYNNAARFTDGLFERFFAFLDAEGLRERSIVVIAGDHGEEFFEEGHLVHSSALNRYQLESPVLIFLPPAMAAGVNRGPLPLASHADVFPTILEALGLRDAVGGLMTGTSLLSGAGPGSVVSAQCSTGPPERLLVQTAASKLVIELDGVQKRGHALFAREMRGTALLDAGYRVIATSASEAGAPVLDRPDIREALSRFIALPPR